MSKRRREAALAILRQTGMWRGNYAPPVYRLAWRMGSAVPPPHFRSFGANALTAGLPYALLSGTALWLSWSDGTQSVWTLPIFMLMTGPFFGLFVALYYHLSSRKHKLPSWELLG